MRYSTSILEDGERRGANKRNWKSDTDVGRKQEGSGIRDAKTTSIPQEWGKLVNDTDKSIQMLDEYSLDKQHGISRWPKLKKFNWYSRSGFHNRMNWIMNKKWGSGNSFENMLDSTRKYEIGGGGIYVFVCLKNVESSDLACMFMGII